MNFAGLYTKYLTDRGQRRAFLETHRAMEARCRAQEENARQEKLLLSGKTMLKILERYVNCANVRESRHALGVLEVGFSVCIFEKSARVC